MYGLVGEARPYEPLVKDICAAHLNSIYETQPLNMAQQNSAPAGSLLTRYRQLSPAQAKLRHWTVQYG
jgi:hypothetical protein